MGETILKNDVRSDYDLGYSIDIIAERYRKKLKIDYGKELTKSKAYKEVCKIIYDYIMERGSIVRKD